ncbi:VF530 family protein [Aurantivibrio plasticivorans]
MTQDVNYSNNPLHGVGLKQLLTELVEHYGFEILYAYLKINCFNFNASIDSSIKFLKKTDWAREKVEAFYLYQYKNLPRASDEQFALPPRDRIIPEDQKPGKPAELSLEDAARLQAKRAKKSAGRASNNRYKSSSDQNEGFRSKYQDRRDSTNGNHSETGKHDPWSKWRK